MHDYDPHCYCAACCEHEDRVTAQIRAEERSLREQRAAYASHAVLRLELVTTPSSGRR